MGGFDPWAKPWGAEGIPEGFSFGTLKEDWDKFDILMRNALVRLPALETAPVRTFLNGPESFTPDNYFILGEAPEVRRYYVGAGFCSGGIAAAGGAGKALAEWIVEDRAPMDLWPADIRRFAPLHGNRRFLRERVSEIVGVHYNIAFPNRELTSGRGLRRSPLHERLRDAPRLLRGQDGLGARQLVRARGRRAGGRLLLRPPELVPVLRGRAPGGPRGGGRLRPDLVRQAPARGRGRGGGAPAALRQRRGGAARPGGLHRDAQRARRLRERPDRHAARRRRLPDRDRLRPGHARSRLDPAPPAGGRARHRHRRDRRLRGARPDGPALARAARARERRRSRRRRVPLPDLPRDRHRPGHRARLPRHVCRRARLGALRAGRAGRPRVR